MREQNKARAGLAAPEEWMFTLCALMRDYAENMDHAAAEDRLRDLGEMVMPDGLHKGRCLDAIPLFYLDSLGNLPKGWMARRVREFVDLAMARVSDNFGDVHEYWTLPFAVVRAQIEDANK